MWLSEGFATYFALLTTEHYEGRDAFVAGLEAQPRAASSRPNKRMPGVAVVQSKPWKGIPNQIVYQKGGWALHMLRGQIGTDKFWAGIREYYRRYRDSNASTADFQRGDGRSLGRRSGVVLPAMAVSRRLAGGGGRMEVRRRGQEDSRST